MKTRCFILFLVILVIGGCTDRNSKAEIRYELGGTLAEFTEPFEYPAFAIDEDRVYVWDSQCVIHIYDGKSFSLIGQFGRKGQGPPDFEYIGYVKVLPDRLCIGQGQKVAYFTKSGEFINALTNPNPTTGGYMPIGRNFIGTRYLPDDPKSWPVTLEFSLYSPRFELIRKFYQSEVPKSSVYNYEKGKRDVLLVRGCHKYEVQNDQVYVGDSEQGFFFSVFSEQGEHLYNINRNYDKRKISSGERNRILDELREALGEEEVNRRKTIINQYIFPEFYPAFADFSVADGKIYVFSYPIPDQPRLVTILDLQGNLLQEVEVPGGLIQRAAGGQSYGVYKGRYYYLVYNEVTDKWELHAEILDRPSKSIH
jgi:hypothetical protein